MPELHDLHYRNTGLPTHALDLYLPPIAALPPPLLVYVHGGAWRTGDKAEYQDLGRHLANDGFAVAVINHSLSLKTLEEAGNPIHHPTHVQDTAAAVAFLSQHAEQYNYRSDRIYLCGHSSAAHIVSLLALAPEHLIHEAAAATQGSPDLLSHIRGIICVEGIYDIPRLLTTWPDYRDFIEQAFGSDPTCYEVSSPQYHRPPNVGSVPPFLIVHSLEDELVDLPQSQEFFNHLVAIGVQSVDLDTSLQGTHFEMLHTQEFAETVAKFMRNLEA